VLDDTDCIVDLARYFLSFTQDESCGKCTHCRIGTKRMKEILDRLCQGRGRASDAQTLETLSRITIDGSLCGLGKTAPNPVLTTLRYFRSEYEAHLQGRCPAKRCTALVRYQVTADCTGCTLCAQHCPVDAIPMTPYQRHAINQELCTRCDTCKRVCPYNAIEVH
jgi:NADH-quinone oxidoreductase subunit F